MAEELELMQLLPEIDDQLMDDNNQIETKVVIKKDNYNRNAERDNDINDEELYSVYHSFDINFDELNKKFTFWRLNVIHMRGVEEMSSEDVLQYFDDYDPNSIEWVNDLSCNIVFNNEKETAIAMIGLTTALVFKTSKESVMDDLGVDVVDADSLSVPVPPGFRWRLGLKHDKSKALLLRFATNSDKKMRGSRNMSQYYSKYGLDPKLYNKTNEPLNENKNRKRYLNNDNDIWSGSDIGSKRLRMRMRADDEEDMIEKRKRMPENGIFSCDESREVSNKKTIWDRLDNDELGNYCAVDADLIQIAFDNQTNSRQSIWRERPLRSSISVVKHKKLSVDKNDLRNRLTKRKSY